MRRVRMQRGIILTIGLGVLALFLLGFLTAWQPPSSPALAAPVHIADLGRLPLAFEPNAGQTARPVRFLVHARGGLLFFTSAEVVLALSDPPSASPPASGSRSAGRGQRVLRLQFVGANRGPTLVTGAPLPGHVNYFAGADPANWRANLPTFAAITYRNLYSGIALTYGGTDGALKGTYTVAPASDPNNIRWRYQGSQSVSVDAAGNLQIRLAGSNQGNGSPSSTPITVTEQAPVATQIIAGHPMAVSVQYVIHPDQSVGFVLGAYDHTQPLIIDPTLTYAAYLGGSGEDAGTGIAVDGSGYAYVTGVTHSTNFPVMNPISNTLGGNADAFVTKLNTTGTAVLYSTYLGGTASYCGPGNTTCDRGSGIAVDTAGNAYVTGTTDASMDFPRTASAFQTQLGGAADAFLSKLDSSGGLAYSTYLGGSSDELGNAVAVDNNGNAYLTGSTSSTNFPTSPNAYQPTKPALLWEDVFVAKINTLSSGSASRVYATYLGAGSNAEVGQGIAVDGSANAYVTGFTRSKDFPITAATAYQAQSVSASGTNDAFLSKLSNTGSALLYSTFFSGNGVTEGTGIALDASGHAYITGRTYATNLPTPSAYQSSAGGNEDGFVAQFNTSLSGTSSLIYATYLGGSQDDQANGIAVDGSANAYIVGQTISANFPVLNAYQNSIALGYDAFVTKLSASGSSLGYSTFLGGNGDDKGLALALDSTAAVYITGATGSSNFPGTSTGATNGGTDAFIAKFAGTGQALPTATPTSTPAGTPKPASEWQALPNAVESRQPCPCVGKPIDPSSGIFFHTFTDLSVPGRGIPLLFSRTYSAYAAPNNSVLGYGWTHSYNIWIDSDSTNWYVHQANGAVAPFPKTGAPYTRVLAQFTHNADGTFVFTQTQGLTRFLFTADGKLAQQVDRNGYATTLSYTAGQLHMVTDSAGRTLTFTYTGGLLTSVGDSTGRSVSFGYTNGDLTAATDVGGQITQFTYYSGHLLHTMADPKGGTVSNVYDAGGRVLTQTDALSRTLQFNYTALPDNGIQTLVTDTLGYTTVYTYDSSSRLTALTQNPGPNQATWQYTYDPNYPLAAASVTDPNDHTAGAVYDSNGNLVEADSPLGLQTNYEYNATNDLLVITDTRGLTTTFTYDANGNPLTITRPVTETNQLAITRFGYDALHPGDVLTVTNPLGNNWRTSYDTYGFVLSTTNPLTETTQFSHDALGRMLSVVDPMNNLTTLAYNTYGAPTIITDTLGYTTRYSYDANQNLQTITNTKGLTTTYSYNADNEVTRVTYPDGTHSDTSYDGDGRVIAQTNPLSQTTHYGYDPFNQVISVTDPLTRTTSYEYDLAGNMIVMTDALGLSTSYEYDYANRLNSIVHSDFTTPNVFFDYNDLDQRTSMQDDNGITTYTYDSLSRLVQVENAAGATVGYQYDLAGNRTGIVYPGGVGTVTQSYDVANRLKTVKDWLNRTTTFTYNKNGALTSQTYPNGVQLKIGRDAASQVISMTQAITATPFLSVTYSHDPSGLLSSANEVGQGTDSYSYDPRNRLTGDQLTASTAISRTWGYDGATEITATRYQTGIQTPITTTRGYDVADELRSLVEKQGSTTTKNLSFSYDDNGNRTSQTDSVTSTTIDYGYDEHNRLISYKGVWQYVYDSDGLRVSKTGPSGTTNFTWDVGAGLPLLLQDSAASYIYGPGGQILEQIQGSTPYYYHADRLGSVRALTNQAGAVLNTYTYDAYGNQTVSTGTVANPFRYAGEYQDAESGLYYLRARYYDPATQQFLTRDPLLAVTGQAYNYAGGTPLNAEDPTGLWVVCTYGGSSYGLGAMGTAAVYTCISERGELGPLWALGGQGSTSGGLAGALGLIVAPDAHKLSDMSGWSVGGGFTLGPSGKLAGLTINGWYSKSTGWYCDAGISGGPNLGLPGGEIHGGFSYAKPIIEPVTPQAINDFNSGLTNWINSLGLSIWLNDVGTNGAPPSEYGFQQYQKMLGVNVSPEP